MDRCEDFTLDDDAAERPAASSPEFGTSGVEKSERTELGAAYGGTMESRNTGSSCTCSAYWIYGKLVRTGNGPSKFRCVGR